MDDFKFTFTGSPPKDRTEYIKWDFEQMQGLWKHKPEAPSSRTQVRDVPQGTP